MLLDPLNAGAIFLGLVLLGLLVAVLWYAARVAQPAPSAPPGPLTATGAMERKVATIFVMSFGIFLLLTGYAIREPVRQAQANEQLLDITIVRGIELYSSLCYSCHGESGQGAVVPDFEPQRLAPPLNRDDLRPEATDERREVYDRIYKTIQRGRPGTPMPAWGNTDGGSLFHEQIHELTLMILNGDRQIEFEGQTDEVWHHVEHLVLEHVEEGTAQLPQQPDVEALPFYQALNERQQQGVRTFLQRGCGSCHVVPELPGAAGTIGPSLEGIATRNPIAGGAVPNTSVQDLANWIENPTELKPGTAMPDLGLSSEEALAVAEFLYAVSGE